jgi:hypothetical protein
MGLLTEQELVALVGLAPDELYEFSNRHKLAIIARGGRYFIAGSDVPAWLEARAKEARPADKGSL